MSNFSLTCVVRGQRCTSAWFYSRDCECLEGPMGQEECKYREPSALLCVLKYSVATLRCVHFYFLCIPDITEEFCWTDLSAF